MSDLYTINPKTHTLKTSTCDVVDDELHSNGNVYEVIILDLCRCMAAAIEGDDTQAKPIIAFALHTVLGSVLQAFE